MTNSVATYQHVQRDLFKEPERYFYCQCDSAEFLAHWRRARHQFRSALKQGNATHFQQAKYVAPKIDDGVVLTEFLSSIIDKLSSETPSVEECARSLQPLIMKYEVFRRLFDSYQENFRRHPSSTPACFKEYCLFAEGLALLAGNASNLQHLSTLLKLNDALSSQPLSSILIDDRDRLLKILEIEGDLIEKLVITR
jgi:hypothetical protein